MIFIYINIAVLAATALAKEPAECHFSESAGTYCFGAAGQPLIFHLSYKVKTSIVVIKDDKQRILKIDKNGKMTLNEEYVNQSESINNVRLKLGNAMKKHAGCYRLDEHDHSGKLVKNVKVCLKILAPVSKLAVSQTCLSPKQMMVSCFFEGDGAEIILSLDGHLLIQSKDQSLNNWTAEKSTASNVAIILHGKLTGNFTCQVWNNFSRGETSVQLEACRGFITNLTAAVIATVVTLLVVVILNVIKYFYKKTRPTTVNEGNFGNEVTYSDVRVIKNTE